MGCLAGVFRPWEGEASEMDTRQKDKEKEKEKEKDLPLGERTPKVSGVACKQTTLASG